MTTVSPVPDASIQDAKKRRSAQDACIMVLIALFWLSGFLHLRADFPNYSPWNDWSKMTDEGWYAGAAIHHFIFGHWYLQQSFNPAIAMPVWPIMLTGWFEVTGVSMVAARALTMSLYGLSLWLLYTVVRRATSRTLAMLTVLLTVVNPFCYAFDRLALLEPLSVFWLLLAFWIAGRTETTELLKQVILALVIFLLVLTKPTNLALVPAVLYLLWASWGWPPLTRFANRSLQALAVVTGAAFILWAAYVIPIAKTKYRTDYRFLFTINAYRVHLSIVPKMAWLTLRHGEWVNPILFWTATAISIMSFVWLRELWRLPIFGAALISIVGQLAFIGYHTNFQPRYYLLIAMPLTCVVVLGLAAIKARIELAQDSPSSRLVRTAFALALLATALTMGLQTVKYALHPQYSFYSASKQIGEIIQKSGPKNPVLLSDSGDDITLWTHVPAVSESYTPEGLDPMLHRYRPQWYAAWQGWEDLPLQQIGKRYYIHEVARFTVFDDPRRRILVLYKISARSQD